MKDELLKILEIKLKYLTDNIEALNRMNANLERENKGLEYIRYVLELFETSDGEYSVYNFSKLDRDNFDKIMVELPHDVEVRFETENCNYEGLIYLINGINSGISLKLTDEQSNAIHYMVDAVVNRQMDYLARIDGILLAKSHLDINDLDELTSIKERYTNIVEKINTNDYVEETDEIIEAINYARVPNETIIEILTYLLQYNSEIYLQKKEIVESKEEQALEEKNDEEEFDLSKPFVVAEEETDAVEIPIFEDVEKEFNDLKLDNIPLDANYEEPQVTEEEVKETSLEDEADVPEEEFDFSDTNYDEGLEDIDLPEVDLEDDSLVDNDFKDLAMDDEEYSPLGIEQEEQNEEHTNEEVDYSELQEEVEEQPETEEGKTSNDDILNLFNEYKLSYENLDDNHKELLQNGNAEEYKEILELLKEKDILSTFEKNADLLVQILVYSDKDVVNKVLEIIENNLSVDKEDKAITTNIMISALPSVFVKEPYGNHETFLLNLETFKSWGLDLINLFDFSREIYVMNHDKMLENYEKVKPYNLEITDKNAKYLLVLPNIEEKIDYYVETVATDTMKNGTGKTFDGSEFIKQYPNKLNSVTDETIKRLRYSSENGKKLFGSKENSLAAEITNLKVDVLNISDEYLRTYFNNEFDELSHEEELRYEKMLRDEKEYSMELDEVLESLNPYLNGLRYNIEGVNISSNKLVRNYNILVKNGVDKVTALIYGACHNSVITKEEYQKVKNTLSNIGGR